MTSGPADSGLPRTKMWMEALDGADDGEVPGTRDGVDGVSEDTTEDPAGSLRI